MDSSFASQMISDLETLSSGFSSFTGGTICGGVWEGEAATNASNQVSSKIDPKIEAVTARLNTLISAITEAQNAEEIKAERDAKQTEHDSIIVPPYNKEDPSAYNYALSKKHDLAREIADLTKHFEESIEKVKSICGE